MKKILILLLCVSVVFSKTFAAEEIDLEEKSNINTPMLLNIKDLKRVQKVFEESGAGDNTQIYEYSKYSTYKVRARTYMDTYVILPDDEIISFAKFGDEYNFRFTTILDEEDIATNMGFIEVRHAGADTNLTIIGESGNIYNFYVRVDNPESPELPHNKVFIEDKNFKKKLMQLEKLKNKGKADPKEGIKPGLEKANALVGRKLKLNAANDKQIGDYLRKLDSMPMNMLYTSQNLDFRYVIYKIENLLAPLAIFDDGYWTYFRMSGTDNMDQLKDYPVVFQVKNGVEQMVNTRKVRNYIIAENLSDNWALRVGERYICIEKNEQDEKAFPEVK